MVGIAEISAGFGSLKAIKDIVQGLNAANLQASINDIKIELQGHVLDAHQALFAAQEAQSADAKRIAQLEQEVVRLKDWEGQKKRYQLSPIGTMAVAYTLKPGMEDGEPIHWLCQTCFDKGHRAALTYDRVAPSDGGRGNMSEWKCPDCKAVIKAGRNAKLSDPSTW